ncbi:MAG: thiamine-phosphate kinase [Thermodesulfobacteriota bacterium]
MNLKKYLLKRTQPRIKATPHDLQEIGEFGLINRIRKWMTTSDPSLIQGIGDDVAVIKMGEKTLLATTDILIEEVHFQRKWIDPYRLGNKALMVNLSDISAMGGIPKYILISLGLPKNLPLSFFTAFYRGLKDGTKRFGISLIGGDTSLSEKIIINICLLGEAGKKGPILRKGAKVGDDLYVSGTLGDSSLGLKILKKEGLKGRPQKLIEKHLLPLPRITLGQRIAQQGLATSMIDVSDGLLIDTKHLLEESNVGARIWLSRIPLSSLYRKWIRLYSKDPYHLALSGGEDYELLFTSPPEARKAISKLASTLKIPITCIGEILPKKEGFSVIMEDGRRYSPARLGFEHFT